MSKEFESARQISHNELPPNIDSMPWQEIGQRYLSPFPVDERFPEVANGELRVRHITDHLGKNACYATVKFGDKRSGERLEIETELTKGEFAFQQSELLEQLSHGIIKKRRYALSEGRTIDVLDPQVHSNIAIEEQEYATSQPNLTRHAIIPLNRELAAPVANTSPQLEPSSKEELRLAIERRYQRNGRLFISVSGMSGSGKTTFAEELADDIGATLIKADDFHVGSRNMNLYGLDPTNHDNPRVYDYIGAGKAALRIMRGQEALIPQYDFATAERLDEQQRIPGNDKGLVIVDGLYANKSSGFGHLDGNAFDILVDRPPYVCIMRRLLRDSTPELGGEGDGRDGIFSDPAGSLKYIMEAAVPTYLKHQSPLQEFDAIA